MPSTTAATAAISKSASNGTVIEAKLAPTVKKAATLAPTAPIEAIVSVGRPAVVARLKVPLVKLG